MPLVQVISLGRLPKLHIKVTVYNARKIAQFYCIEGDTFKCPITLFRKVLIHYTLLFLHIIVFHHKAMLLNTN